MINVTADQSIKVFGIINKYLQNDEESRSLVVGVEEIVTRNFSHHLATLASKEDFRNLEVRMEQGFRETREFLLITMVACAALIITVLKFIVS